VHKWCIAFFVAISAFGAVYSNFCCQETYRLRCFMSDFCTFPWINTLQWSSLAFRQLRTRISHISAVFSRFVGFFGCWFFTVNTLYYLRNDMSSVFENFFENIFC